MKYRILVDVTLASGIQVYEVDAADEEEARCKFFRGEAKCVEEQLEADALGQIEIEEIK